MGYRITEKAHSYRQPYYASQVFPQRSRSYPKQSGMDSWSYPPQLQAETSVIHKPPPLNFASSACRRAPRTRRTWLSCSWSSASLPWRTSSRAEGRPGIQEWCRWWRVWRSEGRIGTEHTWWDALPVFPFQTLAFWFKRGLDHWWHFWSWSRRTQCRRCCPPACRGSPLSVIKDFWSARGWGWCSYDCIYLYIWWFKSTIRDICTITTKGSHKLYIYKSLSIYHIKRNNEKVREWEQMDIG